MSSALNENPLAGTPHSSEAPGLQSWPSTKPEDLDDVIPSSDFFVFAWLKLASWAKHGWNKLFAPISPNIQTAKTITDLWAPATGKKTAMQDRVGCCVFH